MTGSQAQKVSSEQLFQAQAGKKCSKKARIRKFSPRSNWKGMPARRSTKTTTSFHLAPKPRTARWTSWTKRRPPALSKVARKVERGRPSHSHKEQQLSRTRQMTKSLKSSKKNMKKRKLITTVGCSGIWLKRTPWQRRKTLKPKNEPITGLA